MANLQFDKEITALLVIDPYNDLVVKHYHRDKLSRLALEVMWPHAPSRMVEKQRRASSCLAVIVAEQPTETLSPHDHTALAAACWLWSNQLVAGSRTRALRRMFQDFSQAVCVV